MVSLQDPLRLAGNGILVPQAMAPLLALCDGTRSVNDLRIGLLLRTGINLAPGQVESLIQGLDEACMLDNQRFNQVLTKLMDEYRSGPFRTPALAGGGYPADPTHLRELMDDYFRRAQSINGTSDGSREDSGGGRVVGLISPHIDFQRGWRTYAEIWGRMDRAVEEAELIIVLGTDHSGYPDSLNLTKQSYATPWGKLPTDSVLVGRLAEILGHDQAFSQEAHHIGEHSIELASVWLHYIHGGKPKTVLPVLCGGLENLLKADHDESAKTWQAVEFLKDVVGRSQTLVVAAADISHVGPTFGDPAPLSAAGKGRVDTSDREWLEAACSGSSETLRDYMVEHGDPTRICGAGPIYIMSAILGAARGRVIHYDQCPADDAFGSLVSIAGVEYTR